MPGEETLFGAGVHYCATCDGPLYRGAAELAVVGGGNAALEEGLFLSRLVDRVTVITHGPELRASELLRERARSDPAFAIRTNTEITALRGNRTLEEIVLRDLATGAESLIHPAAVFVFIGLDPNTAWLRDIVDLDESGFIRTDGLYRTSLSGVYAGGDCRSGSTKQLASATGDAIAALLQIRSYLQDRSDLPRLPVNA